jgi:CSLREA domain-containing protein
MRALSRVQGSRRLARVIPALLFAALVALPIDRATALASSPFQVTKTADTKDGACNGDCSLREAVVAANAQVGDDVIRVPSGTYRLTRTTAG